MNKAIEAGIALHDFIRSNGGETADWPLQITSSNSETIEELDRLLREFRQAVMTESKKEPSK